KFDLPTKGTEGAVVDPRRPATWRHTHQSDDTSGSYALLEAAARHRAQLGGVALTATHDNRWAEFRSAEDLSIDSALVIEQANWLKKLVTEGNLDLRIEAMRFEVGSDLMGLVSDLKLEITPGELIQ